MKNPLRFAILFIPVLIALVWAGGSAGSSVGEFENPPGPRQFVLTVYAHEDALIRSDLPTDNFGDANPLSIGHSSNYDMDLMLKFDLSDLPPDAVVVSSTLELFHVPNRDGRQAYTVWVDAVTGSWQEMTVTWNNDPGSAYQGDPPTTVAGESGYVPWEVTQIVQGWVGGSLDNYGVHMRGDRSTVGLDEFYSRENPDYPPRLLIYYNSTEITPTPTSTPTNTPTSTPSPTPPGQGSCPGTVWVYPDRDTLVYAAQPSLVYGDEDYLKIYRSYEDPSRIHANTFLHFPIDALVPPEQHIYEATLQLHVGTAEGTAPEPWDAIVYALDGPFNEVSTNWNNQPNMGFIQGIANVSPGSSWHDIDVTEMVQRWHEGTLSNHGLGLLPAVPIFGGAFFVEYRSSEYSLDPDLYPVLEIRCGGATPTPTSTPTRTPTPTNTPTPTISPTPVPETANVEAYHIEITQGVQNGMHSVPLVEGKRTYVRLYYGLDDPVPNVQYRTTARLNIYRNGIFQASVLPINGNAGYLDLVDDPWFLIPDNSFIFELPSQFLSGEIRVQGVIDPDYELPETTHADNYIERTVSFQPVLARDLHLYLATIIDEEGNSTTATQSDAASSLQYTKAAMPIGPVISYVHNVTWDEREQGAVNCDQMNLVMGYAIVSSGSYDPTARSYVFMPGVGDGRSCAAGIPSKLASGWTNHEYVMAHELGHCFGRYHSAHPAYDGNSGIDIGCGAKVGCAVWGGIVWGCPDGFEEYPYDDASISPTFFGPEAVYGFHDDAYAPQRFSIPDYSWKDLMTYCSPSLWPSDFTYERIYNNYFNPSTALDLQQISQITPTDRLVAVGLIYSDTGEADLKSLYVLPDVTWAEEPTPGEYALVLRDADNAELLRYEFTPGSVIDDGAYYGDTLIFSELVPYVEGTVRVDLEGPQGGLKRITSGAALPRVTLLSPNGGEVLAGRAITVTWTASDIDDDLLSFNVQYSSDDGATWQMLATEVLSNSVVIDAANVPGSQQGRFRVLASDGIHTRSDVSDAPFTVPNHRPSVQILAPVDGEIYIVSQTVPLQVWVSDVEEGSMSPAQVRWYSTLDGLLGSGGELSIADLTAGLHTIFVIAEDSEGATDSDVVQIEVYAGPADLPQQPDLLAASPALVVLNPEMGAGSRPIYLYNANNPASLSWTATASEPWVHLSNTSGSTPEVITVWANTLSVPEGRYTATVTFTHDAAPAESATVELSVTAVRFHIYLPLTLRTSS